jgi:hypothetical protein
MAARVPSEMETVFSYWEEQPALDRVEDRPDHGPAGCWLFRPAGARGVAECRGLDPAGDDKGAAGRPRHPRSDAAAVVSEDAEGDRDGAEGRRCVAAGRQQPLDSRCVRRLPGAGRRDAAVRCAARRWQAAGGDTGVAGRCSTGIVRFDLCRLSSRGATATRRSPDRWARSLGVFPWIAGSPRARRGKAATTFRGPPPPLGCGNRIS